MVRNDVQEIPAQAQHRPGAVIFALSFATAAEGIFLGGILPILPAIGRVYHLAPGQAFWVNAAFLLAVGVTCPTLSRLGDIYGHKKIAILTLLMTSIGIFIDMVAPGYFLFLVGRFFLGLCPAVTPLGVGIFRKSLPRETALFGIGILFAAMAAGHALGPVFAGYVVNGTGSIGWVFASWLALLIPAMLMVILLVSESPAPTEPVRMDWPGAIALGLGVGGLTFGFAYGPTAGWQNPLVIGGFGVGALLLVLWYLAERRTDCPLVDLHMLNAIKARPYYISSFLWGAAYYGSQTTLVLYLGASRERLGFGFSVPAVLMGWLLLSQNVMNMLGSLAVRRAVKWLGGYRSAGMIGGTLMALGFAGMMLADGALWEFNLFAVVTLFGCGFTQPILPGRVSEVCGESQRGISAGMFQTFKNIGGSTASALGSVIFATMLVDGMHVAAKDAYMVVFGGCLLISVCMVVVIGCEGIFAKRNSLRPTP